MVSEMVRPGESRLLPVVIRCGGPQAPSDTADSDVGLSGAQAITPAREIRLMRRAHGGSTRAPNWRTRLFQQIRYQFSEMGSGWIGSRNAGP